MYTVGYLIPYLTACARRSVCYCEAIIKINALLIIKIKYVFATVQSSAQVLSMECQYAFHVLATPKLRQAHSSPRQATFFHFRTLQTLRQLKKLYSVAKWKGSPAHLAISCRLCRRAAVFGVSRSAFGAFRLPPFSIALNFFEIMLILLLTVDPDYLFGLWQVTVCFLVNCKDRRTGAQPEICNGVCFFGLGAEPPTLERFVFCWKK